MEEKQIVGEEKTICEVSPSQILNARAFFIGILMTAAIIAGGYFSGVTEIYYLLAIPIVYVVWKWLEISSTKLKITDQRIILRHGVLSKTTNETELYRVRDSKIEEPFIYRIFGCGNLQIYTTDEAEATPMLKAYRKPHWLKDQIRNYSEICRQKKRWGTDNILLHDQLNS